MKYRSFRICMLTSLPMKKITIADDVDVVIVPGDTCEGVLGAFEHLREIVPLHIPIVIVDRATS